MKQCVIVKILVLGIILLLLGGCHPEPNISEIEETIVKHFRSKNYDVIELKIGDMETVSISEKKYMGTPGYVIDVPLLTLQTVKNIAVTDDLNDDEKISFSNVQILIQQHTGKDKDWIIANISGVDAP